MELLYSLAAFSDTSTASMAQRILRENGCKCVFMPTPRDISADCGLSLRYPSDCAEDACRLIQQVTCRPDQCLFYSVYRDEGRRLYIRS
ncbi:MAG: DUF3343 domain-containing protein [Oscillospiraceae bacterium]|nr:DUF3343 domain-containing protein [Oscillospiraceae bacterium]